MRTRNLSVGQLAACGLLTSALTTGCYVEPTQNDDAANKRQLHPNDDHQTPQDPSGCHFFLGDGCLNGHVDAVQSFFVEGKQFFNADDLAARFHELLQVETAGKVVGQGNDGYQLVIGTPLDNQSFLSGFTYDLTGQLARAGELHADGSFGVDDLRTGDYNLRVQRSVKFQLINAAATPSAGQPAATGTPKGKTYCATLYADNSVTVRESRSAWLSINNYRLHITPDECGNGSGQTTLDL